MTRAKAALLVVLVAAALVVVAVFRLRVMVAGGKALVWLAIIVVLGVLILAPSPRKG